MLIVPEPTTIFLPITLPEPEKPTPKTSPLVLEMLMESLLLLVLPTKFWSQFGQNFSVNVRPNLNVIHTLHLYFGTGLSLINSSKALSRIAKRNHNAIRKVSIQKYKPK
jgi:hypothetical protein